MLSVERNAGRMLLSGDVSDWTRVRAEGSSRWGLGMAALVASGDDRWCVAKECTACAGLETAPLTYVTLGLKGMAGAWVVCAQYRVGLVVLDSAVHMSLRLLR